MPEVDVKDIKGFLKELDDVNAYFEEEIAELLEEGDRANSPTANTLIHQYEQVVVKSLITSFGLESILFHDKAGGDVDTIVTVRDKNIAYADKSNEHAYNNRGDYDSHAVHSDKTYIAENRKYQEAKKAGNLTDAYTGEKFDRNAHVDLDHVISGKEAHDDPARVLAGLTTEELVNTSDNLVPTDKSINRSKKDSSAPEFQERLDRQSSERQARMQELRDKPSLSDKEKSELHKLEQLDSVDRRKLAARDKKARASYERRLARTYYTSQKFLKSTATAALTAGAKMGIRQTLGLILTEVWCAVREDFPEIMERMKGNFQLGEFLSSVAESFKRAFKNVREKFHKLIASFKDGLVSGILSSITTTIINMFTVTAKNVGRILRECWSSLVEAFRILFLNPDNLSWAERFKAAAKVIAVAVSVILGGIVQEAVSKMNLVAVPVLSDVIPVFLGSLASGILSVSLIYFLDHSDIIEKLKDFLDSFFASEFRIF